MALPDAIETGDATGIVDGMFLTVDAGRLAVPGA